jgi:magnesium-transporting ATPase (P-type)
MRAEQLSEAGSAAASGLTEAEARRLLEQRGPSRPPQTSRSYASIIRGNVFTVFNLIIAVFGALTLAFGDWRDSLFLGILVVNSGIGIVQEVRAKRALTGLRSWSRRAPTPSATGTCATSPWPRWWSATCSRRRAATRSWPTAR